MEKLFIVDASGYLYRNYFAIRGMTNPKGESTNSIYGFIRSILKLMKDFHPEHLVAVFDGPKSIASRVEIYKEYKAHRKEMPADLRYQIEWAQQYCDMMGIPKLCVSGVEADDTIGSVACWAAEKGYFVYMCTSDKDMAQMVNDNIHLLNTFKENQILDAKGVEEAYGVPPNLIIDLLAMTGDSSDNVPGIAGFGPKTAASLLQQFGSLDAILKEPEKAGGKKTQAILEQKENALISKQLVTINSQVDFPKDKTFFSLKQPDVIKLRDFFNYMNFHTLLRELEQATPVEAKQVSIEGNYQVIDDEESFKKLLANLVHHKEIALEIMATESCPMRGDMIGISLATEPHKAVYLPANGKLGLKHILEGLKPIFENPKVGFFGHNIKEDLHHLRDHGIHVANVTFDIAIASYILNSHKRNHTLETLLLEYFGKVKAPLSDLTGKGKKQIGLQEVAIEQMCPYCCEDVDAVYRLKLLFEKELDERKLNRVFKEIELPLLNVLMEMERTGIFLDVPCLEGVSTFVNKEIHRLEKEIYQLAGEEFNLNSPKQLGEILYNKLGIPAPRKTATGLSTNADVLEFLAPNYPIASKMLEYRTVEKLRSTYIDALPLVINPKDQRIHCTFNQFVAATGRLSCQDPNLQNIPIRSEMGRMVREAFRPQKKGWSYLAADYSQIELRLLAHLSEDPILLQAFQNNEDIHKYTASVIFDVPLEQVTKEQRDQAKAVNFGVIYGQGAFGLSQALGIEVRKASAFINTYFQRYSKVREYTEASKEKSKQSGKAVTMTGRERIIPEINSKNGMLRAAAERLAINTPLQGTAADLIKLAMLKIDQKIRKEKFLGHMILQIHDELIFEIPDFEIVALEPLIRSTMESVFKLKVPLLVDITIGKNWKEC